MSKNYWLPLWKQHELIAIVNSRSESFGTKQINWDVFLTSWAWSANEHPVCQKHKLIFKIEHSVISIEQQEKESSSKLEKAIKNIIDMT